MLQGIQTALRVIYPPRCLNCGDLVESEFGFCGPCWRDTPFIGGLSCDLCGLPLPGEMSPERETEVQCDECLRLERPWQKGRAALLYHGNARKMVLALKHGDRHDIARPAAQWMWRSCCDIVCADTVIVPVPLHWRRMLKRRFNQAALLAEAMAKISGLGYCPDLLQRIRSTSSTKNQGRDARFGLMQNAIQLNPRHARLIKGRPVLLVDDVMTSGATLSACATACQAGHVGTQSVVVLARVAKSPYMEGKA